jgi:outer membrane immunogenic protein
MKGRTLAGIAALTLFDIARAHAQVPAIPNWFGIYVGAHAGYRWGNVNASLPAAGLPSVTPGTPSNPGTATFPQPVSTGVSFHPSNATGGLLGGQNFKWGRFGLVGWEADVTWGKGSSTTGLATAVPATFSGTFGSTGAGTFSSTGTFSATLGWSASLRFRVGYVTGPWLYYGTAGVSVQRVGLSGATSLATMVCDGFGGCLRDNLTLNSASAFSVTKNLIGPVAGVGIERFLGHNFMIRIEYLAAFYGRETFGNVAFNNFYSDLRFGCSCTATATTVGSASATVTTQTLRIALTAKIP